jgi:hypothetical protein
MVPANFTKAVYEQDMDYFFIFAIDFLQSNVFPILFLFKTLVSL